MIEAGEWEQQVRQHLWHDLESEHRHLAHVLDDVAGLVREGSFETARRRFGEYRLAHERHLLAERKLEAFCAGIRDAAPFLKKFDRERTRLMEQSERVWTSLCREKSGPVPRMLERLSALVAEHERAQRRLILGELPISPELRSAQGALLRRLGHL